MKKILIILGPTATGKTDLALKLAKKFNGELVSADSRQVYRGLDIGTGKLPLRQAQGKQVKKGKYYWKINEIKIWMYDVVSPKKQYNVAEYVKEVGKIVEQIISKGKLPIIVGGTGLYLKVLLEGLPNLKIPIDLNLRRKLSQLSLEKLQVKLQELASAKWDKLNNSDRNNKRRLLRSVEIAYMYPYINKSQISNIKYQKDNILKIGLTTPRSILNKLIDARVLFHLNQGMVEEAVELHHQGLSFKRMHELGLEYAVLADYLVDKINKEQLIENLKTKIHQYAKRQMTWFKKEKNVVWFDVTAQNYYLKVEKLVAAWYNDAAN